MPNPATPQSWNRYSYVTNNPLRYTDPTGHMQASEQYKDSDNQCDKGDKACNQMKAKIKLKKDKAGKGASCNQYPCPPTIGQGQECNMYPCPGANTAQSSSDDFTGFWETDRLDGGGFRIGFSIWSPIPFLGGDVSLDVIQNTTSGETSLYFTPSLLVGIGEGGDASFSFVGAYDTPNANSLRKANFGAQANLSALGGAQVSYNYSDTVGDSGKHAQEWGLGPSAGAEASVSGTIGWTFLIVNWKP